MSIIVEDRLPVIEKLKLHSGNGGMEKPCIMDVVDYITGGDGQNDHPACASPVVTVFAIHLNDSPRFEQYRDELKPYIVRIAGSVGTPEQELRRAFAVSDWAVRVIAPMALESVGLKDQAQLLRDLRQIVDEPTATDAARAAYVATYTARAACAATDATTDAAARSFWNEAMKMLDAMLRVTEAV